MNYKVEVGDLSERVKTQVGLKVGHLEFSAIYEYETGKVYPIIPVTLPYGHDVFGAVLYYNDSTSTLSMTCMCEFLDPDGVSRGKLTDIKTVYPGNHKTATTDRVTLSKYGTWRLHSTLRYPDLTDEKTWDAIIVIGPVANVHGVVYSLDGNPVPAVSVTLNSHETATKLDGTFDFLDIPTGPYTITCTKTGYKNFSDDILLREGYNEIAITMEAKEEFGIWEWIKDHWEWIAGGAGAAAAIGIGITISRRR